MLIYLTCGRLIQLSYFSHVYSSFVYSPFSLLFSPKLLSPELFSIESLSTELFSVDLGKSRQVLSQKIPSEFSNIKVNPSSSLSSLIYFLNFSFKPWGSLSMFPLSVVVADSVSFGEVPKIFSPCLTPQSAPRYQID